MRELWLEIQKFKTWAKRKYPGLPLNASGGEWETAYEGWDTIKALFEKTIKNSRPGDLLMPSCPNWCISSRVIMRMRLWRNICPAIRNGL